MYLLCWVSLSLRLLEMALVTAVRAVDQKFLTTIQGPMGRNVAVHNTAHRSKGDSMAQNSIVWAP